MNEPTRNDLWMTTSSDTMQLVTFQVDRDVYAVNIEDVQEINKWTTITHVPRAPRFVEGVINLRGQVLPVINLRERLNLPKLAYDKHTRIVVVQIGSNRVGLIVDRVSEVMRVSTGAIKPTPAETMSEGSSLVSGIVEWKSKLIIKLNLEEILNTEEARELSQVDAAPENGNGVYHHANGELSAAVV